MARTRPSASWRWGVGHAFGQAPADRLFHGGAQFVDLDGFVHGDVAHEHAAVLLGAHQPGFVEHAKGLAHRAARDAEACSARAASLSFVARCVLARQDGAFDLLLHHHGQGVRSAAAQSSAWGCGGCTLMPACAKAGMAGLEHIAANCQQFTKNN
jgi:hypothetical protein